MIPREYTMIITITLTITQDRRPREYTRTEKRMKNYIGHWKGKVGNNTAHSFDETSGQTNQYRIENCARWENNTAHWANYINLSFLPVSVRKHMVLPSS